MRRQLFAAACLTIVLAVVPVFADTHYVSPSGSGTWPYTGWATAATNIQDAVNTTDPGDTVLVGDGYYILPATVTISKNITLLSLNGATNTIIDGGYPSRTNRCLWIQGVTNVTVNGFSIVNGYSPASSGGGVWVWGTVRIEHCDFFGNRGPSGGAVYVGAGPASVTDCLFATNTASSVGGVGGAVSCADCTLVLDRCVFLNNTATSSGGAVYGATGTLLKDCLVYSNSVGTAGGGVAGELSTEVTLINCTVAANHAGSVGMGGGVRYGKVYNGILWANTAGGTYQEDNYSGGTFYSCCTRPMPAGGSDNFTLDPLFVDLPGCDFRLQTNSQCINTGTNQTWMATATDLLGNSRIIYAIVDRGCYESPSTPPVPLPVELGIDHAVEVYWLSQASVMYLIQANTDMTNTTGWMTVDAKRGNGGEMSALFPTRGQPKRFFRVIGSQ